MFYRWNLALFWSIIEANGNGLFCRSHVSNAHILYDEVLVSLQNAALNTKKKNAKVEALFSKEKMTNQATSGQSFNKACG